MVGIYLAIAACAIILVGVFVDNLSKELVEKKAGVAREVSTRSHFSTA